MATTTADVVVEAFEAYAAACPVDGVDGFVLVWGDGYDTLLSVERERVMMFVPSAGPMRAKGARCHDQIGGQLAVRYAVTKEGRARMLRDLEALGERVRAARSGDVAGLVRAHPGSPIINYRYFLGRNAALALLPVVLTYEVEA